MKWAQIRKKNKKLHLQSTFSIVNLLRVKEFLAVLEMDMFQCRFSQGVFSPFLPGHHATSVSETKFISVPQYRFYSFTSASVFDVISIGVH